MGTINKTTAEINTLLDKTNVANKTKVFANLAAREAASTFGVGECQIGSTVYVSDGVGWKPLNRQGDLPTNIVTVGDSIAEFNRNDGGTLMFMAQEGFMFAFNGKRNGAHQIYNVGISGGDTRNIIDVQIATSIPALSIQPAAVFISVGANDFYSDSTQYTAQQVLDNMEYILQYFASKKIQVHLLNGWVRGPASFGGTNNWTLARQQQQQSYIAALPNLFDKYPMHQLYDVYSLASNGSTTANAALPGYLADDLHPNRLYAEKAGLLIHAEAQKSSTVQQLVQTGFGNYTGIASVSTRNIMDSKSVLAGIAVGANNAAVNSYIGAPSLTNCTANLTCIAAPDSVSGKEIKCDLTFSAAGNAAIIFNTSAFPGATDRWAGSVRVRHIQNDSNIITGLYIRAGALGATNQFAYGGYPLKTGAISNIVPHEARYYISCPGNLQTAGTGSEIRVTVETNAAGFVSLALTEPCFYKLLTATN